MQTQSTATTAAAPADERRHLTVAKAKLRAAQKRLPGQKPTTDGIRDAIALSGEIREHLEQELHARARETAQRQANYDPSAVLYDKLGRKRSPATIPGYMAGRPAPSTGRTYPPSPLTVKEIVRLLNHAEFITKNDAYEQRLKAIILVLWRSGMRISEALQLTEADLNERKSTIYIRRGKGGKAREVGVDQWLWELIMPWIVIRENLPTGPLFSVIEGKTAGVDAWGASQVREKFAQLQAKAGIRKRFRPHQLRHTHTVELIMEGKNIVVVQRQLGHSNLAVTTNYTSGLPQESVFAEMRGREMPQLAAFDLD